MGYIYKIEVELWLRLGLSLRLRLGFKFKIPCQLLEDHQIIEFLRTGSALEFLSPTDFS